ncbi:MAG: tRNA (adenosine(37)-N6)-dimethylallyltransferase MiaA [Anaerolineae bacterium]|nr:MAG: tRNA (adenosine(37)-N6)-dimethylallyltransferase MiaA [Anaerolineae bacterium]
MSLVSPLIVIVGPTAVGKTDLAIELALRLRGEVVSADSRLFYRGMDIGTAKPSLTERRGVPHHLIDVAEPDETWSLALFQQRAQTAIEGIYRRGNLPLLVGGTGQYIRAVTQGWVPPEVQPHPDLRNILENLAKTHDPYWLHAKLRVLDPIAADSIDPRNLRRTIRALEVILTTGYPFSAQKRSSGSPYHLITLGLKRPREELYRRIDERIEAMFANGLLEEVQRLLQRGYSPDLPSMSAIGYREAAAVLRGEMSLEAAKTQMKRLTRIFVRRQANWFKETDPAIHWLDARQIDLEELERYIRQNL